MKDRRTTMHVRFIAGPKQGQDEHLEFTRARVLIDSGFAVEIPPEKPKYVPPTPSFSVETTVGLRTPKRVGIRMTLKLNTHLRGEGSFDRYYFGHPDDTNKRIGARDGYQGRFYNGFGRQVPEEIVREYRQMWNANPNLRDPYSIRRKSIADTDNAKMQREIVAANQAVANRARAERINPPELPDYERIQREDAARIAASVDGSKVHWDGLPQD
jgi:hypothetical protein